MKDKNKNRIILIFSISLIVTLMLLFAGNEVRKGLLHQRMIRYSEASARASDGAKNLVVMIGTPGYLGESNVYLKYLDDGYIKLAGDNPNDNNGWKKLSEFILGPGTYTLTGLDGQKEQTIALQLRISDDTGFYRYFYQYDDDIVFSIERDAEATLYARVYPNVVETDVVIRPAVYKENGAL